MRESRDKQAHSNKNVIIAASAIAAVVVLAGVGGYAYASNAAYDSYESRVESAKEVDSKLVKTLAEARTLVKATKDTDVLDKTTLTSLTKSVKTGEALKGVPATSHATKWNLWSTTKAKASVVDDIAKADDSIDAIGKAMSKVNKSKTAKDAKDALDKTVKSAESLYKDSEGKVQDNKTRESLKTALDNAKKTSGDKKADMKSLTASNDALSKAVKAVNDSKNAKAQADAQKQAQEQAQQAQAQAQSVGTPSGGYSGYAYSNVGGSYSGWASQSAPSYSSTGSYSGGSAGSGTSTGGTWDWKNAKDSMGGGFSPITKDNINPDGSATGGGDSHGNMW